MATHSNTIATTTTDLLNTIFQEDVGELFAVDLDETTIEDLIEVLSVLDEPPTVQVLARESVLKWLRGDFILASTAAELIATDTLSLRATDEPFENTLLVTDESVIAVVAVDERVAGLVTDNTEFVASAREHWTSVWDTAEEFPLRTPARSLVHDSLETELGPTVEADFRTMLDALNTARGENNGLDEVMVSLLAAAKNEQLLYDISKWGEDAGVASKATFSRTKNRLEEHGLIATEKVAIDIGRPRMRLVLGDERLREADADELASAVQSVLSTARG